MSGPLYKRVSAAAVAMWWTLLIGAIIATLQWLAFMHIMHGRPAWIERMLGGGMEWSQINIFLLTVMIVVRLLVLLILLLAIWLSLWARGLKKLD